MLPPFPQFSFDIHFVKSVLREQHGIHRGCMIIISSPPLIQESVCEGELKFLSNKEYKKLLIPVNPPLRDTGLASCCAVYQINILFIVILPPKIFLTTTNIMQTKNQHNWSVIFSGLIQESWQKSQALRKGDQPISQ